MSDDSASEDDAIWMYVSPRSVHVPEPPVEEQLYTGLSVVRKGLAWFRARVSGGEAPGAAETEGGHGTEDANPLPDSRRDTVAPAPDWTGAVAALNDLLDPVRKALERPRLVYEAGYHGAPSILRAWGTREGLTVLEPPSRDRLGEEQGSAWVDRQRTEGTPWVLPCLEHWWVRTPSGMAFVRSLLDAWAEGVLGRGVIGVDRYAWSHLKHAWPGQVSHRYVLRPLPAEDLARWFGELAREDGASDGTVEEQRGGGHVLPGPEGNSASPEETGTPSSYLRSLAAYSDGDPGVAWTLWRQSLKVPSAESPESVVAEVPPWSEADRPERPTDLERPDFLLLHALVLHGGLSDASLDSVVPLDRYERRERLRELGGEGLLKKLDEAWQVTPSGYPVVCDLLRDEAYLSRQLSVE